MGCAPIERVPIRRDCSHKVHGDVIGTDVVPVVEKRALFLSGLASHAITHLDVGVGDDQVLR
jgi:hypothetical protein